MTKAEWVSVIKNTIRQGEDTSLTRGPFIERHIQSVYEQMFNEMYARNPRGIWPYVRDYSETDSSGTNLSTDGYTLSTLPIVLPRKTGGLFKFSTTDKSYVVADKQGFDSVNDSAFDTAGMKGLYVAYLSGDKVYANASTSASDTVSWSIVPKFTSLSATDEVLIPSGQEDHFIDRVIMTIKQTPPEIDMLNDNA